MPQRERLGLAPPVRAPGPARARSPRGRCRPAARSAPPGTTAPWPLGDRATSTASSRSNATYSSAISGDAVGQHGRGLGGGLAHPHALAVVAAADRLEHDRPASRPRTPRRRRWSRTGANRGQAMPSPVSRSRIASLSWVYRERRCGRAGPDAGALERGQVRAGHVLVVERDHVAPGRERGNISQASDSPQPIPAADLGGALLRRAGQHPEADAEADRGLAGHPGELAAAYHADHWHHRCRPFPCDGTAEMNATGGAHSRNRHAPYPTGPAHDAGATMYATFRDVIPDFPVRHATGEPHVSG